MNTSDHSLSTLTARPDAWADRLPDDGPALPGDDEGQGGAAFTGWPAEDIVAWLWAHPAAELGPGAGGD